MILAITSYLPPYWHRLAIAAAMMSNIFNPCYFVYGVTSALHRLLLSLKAVN
jgi:hypothetical protein